MSHEIYEPRKHDKVVDTVLGIVAEVMEIGPSRVNLRKLAGGVEWERDKTKIRQATTSDIVGLKVKLVNAQTANRPTGIL